MERVAIVGGDGRFRDAGWRGAKVRVFRARRYGGNGSLRKFEQAIRAGGVDRVVVLARWNSHSTTSKVMRLCRGLGVPVEIIP